LLLSARALRAAPPEERGFNIAAESFALTAYEKAERELGAFVQTYPESPKVIEAVLLQAEARIALSNYSGALELLTSRENQAGTRTDAYLFWAGEAAYGAGDYQKAVQFFERLQKDFPGSTNRLEALVKQADAHARLGEWAKIIELLGATNSVLQVTLRTNIAPDVAVRGSLLLAEAQFKQQKLSEAEATLVPFAKLKLSPINQWRWDWLMCQIQVAQGKKEAALATSSNLVMMAGSTQLPALQAQSYAFQAEQFEALGRLAEAALVYTNNLQESTPATRQEEAVQKTTALAVKQDKLAEGAVILERFATNTPGSTVADLALLNAGELRLRQFVEAQGSAANTKIDATGTNAALREVRATFELLSSKYPQSPHAPQASLNLGWCYWYANDFSNSAVAFSMAAERLPPTNRAATARFKLGDALYAQQQYQPAITNYNRLIEQFRGQTEVETNLFEPALYQIIRAAIATNDLTAATNALSRIIDWYPNSFRTKTAVLLAGQIVASRGDPIAARSILAEFVNAATNTQLTAEAELALAATYEQQQDWTNAVNLYNSWLLRFTNHSALPRAEYSRAVAVWKSGDATNAFPYFTNFVARFPSNSLTPLAARWVADYHFTQGAYTLAETDYQLLSRSYAGTEFGYEARLMAGRAAYKRYSWTDAAAYFLEIYTNSACPKHIQYEALYELGDTYMSQDTTNKLDDYKEAINIFKRITQEYGTNELAALAWGEMASCYLQWAQNGEQLTNSIAAFREVIASPVAPPVAREIARVGIGVVLERQAKDATPEQQRLFLNQALQEYVQAFQGADLKEGEVDIFWTRKSGLEATRLAMDLQQWSIAERVCEKLIALLPQIQPSLQDKLLKIRAQQAVARKGG